MSTTKKAKKVVGSASPRVRLISVPQLAKNTGVSTRTIWRRVADGELPKPFLFGNKRVWREETIARKFETLQGKAG